MGGQETDKRFVHTKEHEATWPAWRDKWIANAMSTRPMDDADREAMRVAIRGMYTAAKLEPPPDHRIVFVPSPFVLRFAAGFAAGIWHLREYPDLHGIVHAVPTETAVDASAGATAGGAVATAVDAGTKRGITSGAPADARATAVDTAGPVNDDAWYRFDLASVTQFARRLGPAKFLLACAARWWSWNGGNQWSGWCAYLSWFRDVAKLDLPEYANYAHYEAATLHGGPRILHKHFAMVSDRPELLLVDERNRPHNATGPFCRWRDGSELYAWHGTYVPAAWILRPESLDPQTALTHENVEQRRAAAEIIGWARVLEHVKARVIDQDEDPQIGVLLEVDLPQASNSRFLRVRCPTGRDFVLPVPQTVNTALGANAWTYGIEDDTLLRGYEVRT